MTTGELATICTAITLGLGGCGTVLKIIGSQIATELGGTRKAIEANTEHLLKFVASAARLEVKLEQAHAAALKTAETVDEVIDEISGVHDKAPTVGEGWKTPPGGYSQHKRKGTAG